MALTIVHNKVATFADQPDVEINKAEWNDAHGITGVLDQTQNNVAVDGVTITGDGTPGNPLVAITGVAWGDITGTLSSQTDLQTVLDGKLNLDQTTPQTISNGIPLLNVALTDFNNEKQLVNKEYVDSSINFIADYYFINTISDIGGIYYQMVDTDLGEPASTLVKSSLGAGAGQVLYNFITPALGVDLISKGVYTGHIHATKTSGTRSVNLYFELFSRTSGGTETLLATSDLSPALTGTNTSYNITANITNNVTINLTDRLVIKWFANVGSSGSAVDVTLYLEDNYNSLLEIPIQSSFLSQIYLRQDGTKPLTGNWNAGAFDIASGSFNSNFISAGSTSGTNTGDQLSDPNFSVIGTGILGDEFRYNEVVVVQTNTTYFLTDADIYKVFITDGSTPCDYDFSSVSQDFTCKFHVDARNAALIRLLNASIWVSGIQYTTEIKSDSPSASMTVRMLSNRLNCYNIAGIWKAL